MTKPKIETLLKSAKYSVEHALKFKILIQNPSDVTHTHFRKDVLKILCFLKKASLNRFCVVTGYSEFTNTVSQGFEISKIMQFESIIRPSAQLHTKHVNS